MIKWEIIGLVDVILMRYIILILWEYLTGIYILFGNPQSQR